MKTRLFLICLLYLTTLGVRLSYGQSCTIETGFGVNTPVQNTSLIEEGNEITISAPAIGTTYQWLKDGVEISGATQINYYVAATAKADAGLYTCLIDGEDSGRSLQLNIQNTAELLIEADKQALIALYNTNNGANWNNKTNWDTDEPLYNWHGVQVNSCGRVIKLNLSNNNLQNDLTEELFKLTELTHLTLTNNNLTGPLSPKFGDLKYLQDLTMYGNNFSGTLPKELGNLTDLIFLNLANNKDLTGDIPVEIMNLTKLQSLALGLNKLTGSIPSEIGNLTELYGLTLGNNQLSGEIPSEIWSLTNLSSLQLHANALTGNIDDFVNLTKLTKFQIHGNQFTGTIPTEIGNLTQLKYFYIGGNNISGTIPATIGNLTALQYIHAGFNNLTGTIPNEIGNLTDLRYLGLGYNSLSGDLPHEIFNLNKLTDIDFRSCGLTGTIPTTVSNLTELKTFWIPNNKLSGDLPEELKLLTKMNYLYVTGNDFTSLPDLSNLTNLQYLFVNGNYYDFDDIVPNIGVASTGYNYAPQQKVDLTYADGKLTTTATGETYTWYKDNTEIAQTNVPTFEPTEIGSYKVQITHSAAPLLVLNSDPIEVAAEVVWNNIVNAEVNGTSITKTGTGSWSAGATSTNKLKAGEDGWVETLPSTIITHHLMIGLSTPNTDPYFTSIKHALYLKGTGLEIYDQGNHIKSEGAYLPTDVFRISRIGNNIEYTKNGTEVIYTAPLNNPNEDLVVDLSMHSDGATLTDVKASFFPEEIDPQRTALEALYNATDGDNWSVPHDNWMNNDDISTWEGVIVDGDGFVTNINLNQSGLNGVIPPEIKNLTKLTELYLNLNNLTGSIPDELGSLTSLKKLYLRNNSLTSIPASIGNLTKLERFSFSNNQITTIPSEFSNLSNITLGYIYNNILDFNDLSPILGMISKVNYITQANVILNFDGTTLTADAGGKTHRWFKDGLEIQGENNNSFTPTESGNYYCIINNNDFNKLTLTSDIKNVVIETSSSIANPGSFETSSKIFPNPAKSNSTLNMELNSESTSQTSIQLYNVITGELVLNKEVNMESGINNIQLSTSRIAKGNYLLKYILNGKVEMKNIVVE